MSNGTDAALWAWFLYDSGLPTQRAKALLASWSDRGLALREVLDRLPSDAPVLGLTRQDAAALRTTEVPAPEALPATQALTWEDERYPAGLRELPIKLRPALLYYRGDPELLDQPLILYLAPGELGDEPRERLRETIDLVLGELLLLGVYEGSDQAALLFEEMAYTEGEAVLFATAGLATRTPTPTESALIEAGRLIVVSPLPPSAAHQPSWTAILQQVAAAAADRVVLSGTTGRHPKTAVGIEGTPAISIETQPAGMPAPENVQTARVPGDVLLWLDDNLEAALDAAPAADAAASEATAAEGSSSYETDEALSDEVELGPPPSPEEILSTLEGGGNIPEVLRRRLLGEETDD
jgi:hypothetical protein